MKQRPSLVLGPQLISRCVKLTDQTVVGVYKMPSDSVNLLPQPAAEGVVVVPGNNAAPAVLHPQQPVIHAVDEVPGLGWGGFAGQIAVVECERDSLAATDFSNFSRLWLFSSWLEKNDWTITALDASDEPEKPQLSDASWSHASRNSWCTCNLNSPTSWHLLPFSP